MAIYARIVDNKVREIYNSMNEHTGVDYPPEIVFHPDFVAQMVDVTDVVPLPNDHWNYDGEVFTPPDVE